MWDTFSHTAGKTFEGQTGDVADDSYHLYKQDVQLLKALGVSTYRMSISWSRIFPAGTGQPNAKGVDYYSRVIDELMANHITPYVTLFHWDLPQALPGGWQSRDTPKAFGDYAAFIGKHFSDRVKHFMTTNEFTCFTDLGYRVGQFAPGLKLANGPRKPGAASWNPGAWLRRAGFARQHACKYAGRACGKRDRLCAGD